MYNISWGTPRQGGGGLHFSSKWGGVIENVYFLFYFLGVGHLFSLECYQGGGSSLKKWPAVCALFNILTIFP